MVKCYKVDCLVEPDGTVKRNVYLIVREGRVLEKSFKPYSNLNVIPLRGTLYPPFVNAHTHLELSSLSFSPDRFKGFFEWLLWIIGKRQLFTKEWVENSYRKGLKLLEGTGTAYVGDISSFGFSTSLTVNLIKVTAFLEIIGKDREVSSLTPPLSAHSVYSVSFELLKKIGKDSLERDYPFQIHLGEVAEERLLVSGKPNRFESDIYPAIGRKKYPMPKSESLVDYLEKAGALHENTVAVHCTNLSKEELKKLKRKRASIVLCPRSNLHLKVGFPLVEEILGYDKVALGTDGMSSNLSLNVLEELKVLYYSLNCRYSLRELFYLVTLGGAKVLRIEDYREKALFAYLEEVPEYPLDCLLTFPFLKLVML